MMKLSSMGLITALFILTSYPTQALTNLDLIGEYNVKEIANMADSHRLLDFVANVTRWVCYW